MRPEMPSCLVLAMVQISLIICLSLSERAAGSFSLARIPWITARTLFQALRVSPSKAPPSSSCRTSSKMRVVSLKKNILHSTVDSKFVVFRTHIELLGGTGTTFNVEDRRGELLELGGQQVSVIQALDHEAQTGKAGVNRVQEVFVVHQLIFGQFGETREHLLSFGVSFKHPKVQSNCYVYLNLE